MILKTFGAKICSDYAQTLSVARSEQFSGSLGQQISSKDKYLREVKRRTGNCVYYPLNIFRNTGDLLHVKIGEYF